MKEERALIPFDRRWSRAGDPSGESVVVLLYDQHKGRDQQNKPILKWNRRFLESADEAIRVATFSKRSLSLYRVALGEEFIIPTSIVVGAKRDGIKDKFKVYLIQPYIDGWDGKTLPEELRNNPYLIDQWRTLYERLSSLYTSARMVNRGLAGSPYAFPITLTVGDSRVRVIEGGTCDALIPATPNILIDKQTLRLKLEDFGRYTVWQDEMQESYDKIMEIAGEKSLENFDKISA